MKRLNITSTETVAIVRSAHIGDFLVCIPLIERLITDNGIQPENIYFIIINNNGTNPVEMSFGNKFFPAENVFIVNSSPLKMLGDVFRIRKKIGSAIDHVCYLPFSSEPASAVFKKIMFLKLIFGVSCQINGTYFIEDKVKSNSQYLSLLERYGYEYDRTANYINFLQLDTEETRARVEHLMLHGTAMKFALYPNSKLSMKIWHKDNYIYLIKELCTKYDPVIYLIGSSEDAEYNQTIMDCCPEAHVQNIAGKLNVRETMLFLSEMDILIGNDGSPVHMAALVNTPIVGIYTCKEPAGAWDPVIADYQRTVRANVACKECYKSGCQNVICLEGVSVRGVLEHIDVVLKLIKKEPNS